MLTLTTLIKRNIKLFFKDKGLFFVSLITPLILLVLYATFLFKVFEDSFKLTISQIPNIEMNEKLIESFVSCQLTSSLLAVSCVTIAFCSNAIMVQDKYSDTIKDFLVTPVKKSTLALSYYIATMISTLLISYVGLALCLGYIAIQGFHLTFADVGWIILDVFLLVNFGVALSSCVHFFLKTQGHMSAVGTIVSSCYGFICGAYMPMSNFPEGLQKALMFLPGTYATSLLRMHAMHSTLLVFDYPAAENAKIMENMDMQLSFFGDKVPMWVCYIVLVGATLLLIGIYILENALRRKTSK